MQDCLFGSDGASDQFGLAGFGGAIYIAGGSVTINNCTFEDDSAGELFFGSQEGFGGAIYIAGGSVAVSSTTTFAGDFASTSNPDIYGPFILF